jgi:hypothetical protein
MSRATKSKVREKRFGGGKGSETGKHGKKKNNQMLSRAEN